MSYLRKKKNFGLGHCLGKVGHPILPVVFLRLDPRTYSRSGPLTHSSLESQSSYPFLVDTRVCAVLRCPPTSGTLLHYHPLLKKMAFQYFTPLLLLLVS